MHLGERVACFLGLGAFLTMSACGDSTGSGGIDPNDYVGTWEVQVEAAPECWEAFTLRFVIAQQDADAANDRVMNVVEYWWEGSGPPTSHSNSLSGNINWERDDFQLLFHKIFGSGDFRGDGVEDSGRLDGLFDDPNGVFASLDPGRSGCEGSASATHVSTVVQ